MCHAKCLSRLQPCGTTDYTLMSTNKHQKQQPTKLKGKSKGVRKNKLANADHADLALLHEQLRGLSLTVSQSIGTPSTARISTGIPAVKGCSPLSVTEGDNKKVIEDYVTVTSGGVHMGSSKDSKAFPEVTASLEFSGQHPLVREFSRQKLLARLGVGEKLKPRLNTWRTKLSVAGSANSSSGSALALVINVDPSGSSEFTSLASIFDEVKVLGGCNAF